MAKPAETMKTVLFLIGFLGGFLTGICYLLWDVFKDA